MPSYSQVLLAWVMVACRFIRIRRLSTVFASLKRIPHYFVPPWSICPYHMHETSILWSNILYVFSRNCRLRCDLYARQQGCKMQASTTSIRMQNNSKSFRMNILITAKLESQCDEIWHFSVNCWPKRTRLHFLYEYISFFQLKEKCCMLK